MAKPSWLHGCRRLTESSHSTGLGIRFPDSALMPCADCSCYYWQTPIKKETGSELIARMIAEAPSSSLPVRGADAIPYDELSDTEPEEEEAEGSPKKHPPSPACSNATQQFCSSEPSSLEPSPTKPEPEPKPAYDGPAMRTRSKTKHA